MNGLGSAIGRIVGGILTDPIKSKLRSSKYVIEKANAHGLGKLALEDKFASIYAHAVVSVAAQQRPKAWIDFLLDDDVSGHLETFWANRDKDTLRKELSFTVASRNIGDALKDIGANATEEIEGFLVALEAFAHKARSPGDQQIWLALDEVRKQLREQQSAPLEEALATEWEQAIRDARGNDWVLSRLSLFCIASRVAASELDAELATRVANTQRAIESHRKPNAEKRARSEWTDSAREIIETLRARSREQSLGPLTARQLLLELLRDPGEVLEEFLIDNNVDIDALTRRLGVHTTNPFEA